MANPPRDVDDDGRGLWGRLPGGSPRASGGRRRRRLDANGPGKRTHVPEAGGGHDNGPDHQQTDELASFELGDARCESFRGPLPRVAPREREGGLPADGRTDPSPARASRQRCASHLRENAGPSVVLAGFSARLGAFVAVL
jgi:hypothetical protein